MTVKNTKKPKSPFSSIEAAVDAFRDGRMIIVVDDEDRENEGDLTVAAEKVTPEIINFMAKEGRGLICMPMTEERLDELDIPQMVPQNTARFETAFCVSIEAKYVTSTGISAADRAATVLAAIDPKTRPADLARPGHMFPLKAVNGGVLVRAGQTEAAVDLARIAGLYPAGVICEIMNPYGTMARVPELIQFCREHDLKMISVAELIRYRLQTERVIRRTAVGTVHTEFGDFRSIAYTSSVDPETHLALIHGDIRSAEPVLVRMHANCTLGDIFSSIDCDCHQTIRGSLKRIAEEGRGALVYLHQSAMSLRFQRDTDGVRILPHVRGANYSPGTDGQRKLQHEAGMGAQIIADLGLRKIRLLTNHPRKILGLEAYGIEVVSQEPVPLS